jgi:hypothetical protein
MPSTTARVATTLLPLALLPLPGAAVTVVPNAEIIATVLFNQGQTIAPATFGQFSVPAPGGGMVLDLQGQPFPAATASGQITGNANTANLFGRSGVILNYFVGVNGPANPAVPVLVDVVGFATAQASTGASFAVITGWQLSGAGALLASDLVQSGQQTGSFGQGFQRTAAVTMNTQNIYQVQLRVDTGLAATNPGSSASGSAFIDPYFRFGSGVDTSLYQFIFSSGIGNAPVPEPASYGLMALGLALLAARRFKADS